MIRELYDENLVTECSFYVYFGVINSFIDLICVIPCEWLESSCYPATLYVISDLILNPVVSQ